MKVPPSKLRLAVPDSDIPHSGMPAPDVIDASSTIGAEIGADVRTSGLLRADALRSHIETQLMTHGSPLRWAITRIDYDRQTAHVEAVVTTLSTTPATTPSAAAV